MTKNQKTRNDGERGMALVTALLATTMMLGIGLAVVMSATTDNSTTRVQRVGNQAFFAADAGIGIARRSLAQALTEQINLMKSGSLAFYRDNPSAGAGQFPDVQVMPPISTSSSFYQNVITRTNQLSVTTARAQKFDQLNGTKFSVSVPQLSGNVALHVADAFNATEITVIRYLIKVTGETSSGGSATVNETGRISINLTLAAAGGPGARNFKFSGFGAFFDNGDTQATAPLASGTFSGPVHTNTHFAFLSNRSVTFRNIVSQVDSQIRYDNTSTTSPNHSIPTGNITGINISSEGYKTTDPVPLPDNNFSQEYAVINSTGITDKKSDGSPVDPPAVVPKDSSGNPIPVFDSAGRVTASVLAENLRDERNNKPVTNTSGTDLVDGVYVSSNGSAIAGAGIYVEGDASDLQVYADTDGDQVYVITQGSKVTTIRTDFTNNQTTITSGSHSQTYSGVFTDKSDPANPKPGVSLFVDGQISSLRGGKNGSTNRPAVASATRMTITAQRDITVTGDLKYTNAVANIDGTPVSNIDSVQNVFGIFTNDGNLNLAPNSNYVSGPGIGLEINAAVITFNKNTSNDGGQIEGSIVYTGSATPGTNDRWRLVGSRVQSKINSIGYNYRDIFFDTRYSGGTFSPPFFPGTSYKLFPTVPTKVKIAFSDDPAPTAMSWFRDNN
jgi:Tfp pilus assembly protein PilX